jgi:predicted RNase H-like nuclease (RuvC/YqgF family)
MQITFRLCPTCLGPAAEANQRIAALCKNKLESSAANYALCARLVDERDEAKATIEQLHAENARLKADIKNQTKKQKKSYAILHKELHTKLSNQGEIIGRLRAENAELRQRVLVEQAKIIWLRKPNVIADAESCAVALKQAIRESVMIPLADKPSWLERINSYMMGEN